MRYFKSDNTAAVSREILDAIAGCNTGVALAYGADRWSDSLDEVFGAFFETKVRVFTVSSGTAANALALAKSGKELFGQLLHHLPLVGAGVLRLVEQDVVDALVELELHPGSGIRPRQKGDGAGDQVVEIEEAATPSIRGRQRRPAVPQRLRILV